MTQLETTLKEIRDEKLPLEMLERYRDTLIHLKTDLLKAVAEKKKERALFLIKNPDKSAVARKMEWEASEAGQRLIELEADLRGLPDEIDGLMSRIYSLIR